ncbi:MAG: Y-family DNA polymerase [Pseudomonadota bacterium]
MSQYGGSLLVSLAKPDKQIALVDCNNFYVSCERVFQPAWEHRPVGVLSNNDGCIVARSNELKQAGIPMAAPYFKYRQRLQAMKAVITSSNYTLYGDMSDRVMRILSSFTPSIEIYSIDEAWLDLTGFQDIHIYARKIACETYQATGIPVSIGVAPTKTLAKIMNHQVKKYPCATKSLIFPKASYDIDALLSDVDVGDIWGIGKRWASSLKSKGIYTAKDLRDAPSVMIRKAFNVIMLRTQAELRGIQCFHSEDPAPKKQIISSRSFGRKVTDKKYLKEALAMHVAKAAQKLREQETVCGAMVIKIRSSPFSKTQKFYARHEFLEFSSLTSDTLLMTQKGFEVLEQIYKPDILYAKVGVVLCDIRDKNTYQGDFFTQDDIKNRHSLMQVIDKINHRFGKGTLIHGAEGLTKPWSMKNQHRTAAYTTDWHDIIQVS